MNTVMGVISEIQSQDGISLVKLKAGNTLVFTSIVLDTPETATYLRIGNQVKILFKETEVIISKDQDPKISVQNKIPCSVQSIKAGVLLSQVNLRFEETDLTSIITSNACKQLNLKENDLVIGLIKTNEVILSSND